MHCMINMGCNPATVRESLDAVTESIIRVLGAAEIYRSEKVALKALEVLENSTDFSVKDTKISNCNFTNQEPPAPASEPEIVLSEGIPIGTPPINNECNEENKMCYE